QFNFLSPASNFLMPRSDYAAGTPGLCPSPALITKSSIGSCNFSLKPFSPVQTYACIAAISDKPPDPTPTRSAPRSPKIYRFPKARQPPSPAALPPRTPIRPALLEFGMVAANQADSVSASI